MATRKNHFKVTLAGEDLGVFDDDELGINDAMTFENNTGMTFNDMLLGLSDRSKAAPLRALVWFMRFKQGTPVDLLSLEFKLTALVTTAVESVDPTGAGGRRGKGATKTSATSPKSAT